MNTIVIIQTIVAYFIGIMSLVMVNNILNGYLRRKFKISERNLAYGILQIAIILATALILSSVIDPGVNAIRLLNQGDLYWFQNRLASEFGNGMRCLSRICYR